MTGPGSGRLGVVYKGRDTITGEFSATESHLELTQTLPLAIVIGEAVAIKLEKLSTTYPQLANERDVYKALQNGFGIPCFHWFGIHMKWNVLVISRLGQSLKDLMKERARPSLL